jgi:glycerate kinase
VKSILVAPDSFKGTYRAQRIADAIVKGIQHFDETIPVVKMPIADGGEGTLACVKSAIGGTYVTVPSYDPWMRPIRSRYLMLTKDTALIELAQTAGLHLAGRHKDPSRTTTYGVGVQIRHAVLRGAKTIYLAIGGSATNDAGTGLLQALGIVFRDEQGIAFHPRGESLAQIAEIDESLRLNSLSSTRFVTLCDVENPLFGPLGAAAVFAPQKGADEPMVARLDEQLRIYADTLARLKQFSVDFPGAGAAGGTSVAAKAFLHSTIQSGIQTLLKMTRYEETLQHASLVITGEGRLDSQSYQGKVLSGLLTAANAANVGVVVLAGRIDASAYPLREGILEAWETTQPNEPLQEASKHTLERLEELAKMAVSRHYQR